MITYGEKLGADSRADSRILKFYVLQKLYYIGNMKRLRDCFSEIP
ncbi:MAG: hypothetical protein SPH68_04495 [Candidatus Borkfalkiaceae bacterium]|nr:hypothetical protein [Clostridia bacterium]MDY6223398.1 hypothetical protein [Christensenellaceae bacterium]